MVVNGNELLPPAHGSERVKVVLNIYDIMFGFQLYTIIISKIFLFSGIIWPIQAMPKALSYISLVLPQTYASEALRAVLFRGMLYFRLKKCSS